MCANRDTGFTAAIRDARPSRGDHLFAHRPRSPTMLHYAVVFLVIALIAALFGFGGIAAGAVGIAKILFLIFAVLAVVTFLFGLTRKS
jgi:uncharacterized membrane protein YtjA (UPF0391 family)